MNVLVGRNNVKSLNKFSSYPRPSVTIKKVSIDYVSFLPFFLTDFASLDKLMSIRTKKT